jgi:hypothetical protein
MQERHPGIDRFQHKLGHYAEPLGLTISNG